jgi:hypothetical protein
MMAALTLCQRSHLQDHPTKPNPTGTLKVKGEGFQANLEGDQDFLLRAWEALRPQVLERAGVHEGLAPQDQITLDLGPRGQAAQEQGAQQQATQSQPDPTSPLGSAARGRLQIKTCHDLYEKVYAVDREVARGRALGQFLDMSRVGCVLVEHPMPRQADALLGEVQALWSRLTRRGRRELGGGA